MSRTTATPFCVLLFITACACQEHSQSPSIEYDAATLQCRPIDAISSQKWRYNVHRNRLEPPSTHPGFVFFRFRDSNSGFALERLVRAEELPPRYRFLYREGQWTPVFRVTVQYTSGQGDGNAAVYEYGPRQELLSIGDWATVSNPWDFPAPARR